MQRTSAPIKGKASDSKISSRGVDHAGCYTSQRSARELTLGQIASIVEGDLKGDVSQVISGIADLRVASKQEISFLDSPKYYQAALKTSAGALLVTHGVEGSFPCALIYVSHPAKAFAKIVELFSPLPLEWPQKVHPTAVVASSVKLPADVHVGPHAVIEEGVEIGEGAHIGAGCYVGHHAKLGAHVFLHPHVIIGERCILGERVIIHAGAVIGSDGFGYQFADGRHQKIPQLGYVQIDRDVEIGANVTIDRARYGRTWIGEGTKIDNLVMIAHNVIIGKHSLIVAQSGFAGSVRSGDYVTVAGQVGIAGHLSIGDRATITAQSGVSKDCKPGVTYSGHHARPMKEMMEIEAYVHRLPELYQRVKALEES